MKHCKRSHKHISVDMETAQLTSSGVEMDSDLEDDKSCTSKDSRKYARQNHSEIEKRRRDKMNSNIIELSTLIPMCSAMNKKLDKLTVLRMAVEFMKIIQGSADVCTEVSTKTTFLTDEELKHMVLKSADGFLFVVGCDRGKILYTSESVKDSLNYTQSELIGQSLFDFLHPKDISKMKEQLLSSDISPREKLIDAKTLLPVKAEMPQRQSRLSSGARRTFFCRIKNGNKISSHNVKSERDNDVGVFGKKKKHDSRNYSIIHCTGYLKSWPPTKIGLDDDNDIDSDSCNLSCLVAVGKLQKPFKPQRATDVGEIPIRPQEFVARYAMDGKFTYVDQRATEILGYLPQELLGTSVYEYYHQDDLSALAETHRKVLTTNEKLESPVYRFKSKDTTYIHLKTKAFTFHNPWTKEVETIVTTNTVVPVPDTEEVKPGPSEELEVMSPSHDETNSSSNYSQRDSVQGSASSRRASSSVVSVPVLPGGFKVGAGKIGRQIAEEVLELQNTKEDASSLQAQLWRKYLNEKNSSLKIPNSSSNSVSLSERLSTTNHPKASSANPASVAASDSSSRPESEGGALGNPGSEDVPSVSSTNPRTSSNTTSAQNGLSVMLASDVRSGNNIRNQPLSEVEGVFDILEPPASDTGSTGSDEAAMAIIMSLLEADAGLGGPIDFSDLPWPL